MIAIKRLPNAKAYSKTRLGERLQTGVKGMITPKQTAKTLDVSTSTLRRWSSEFEPFLSRRTGTKRTYTTDDIATLKRVKDLFSQGMTTAQVRKALQVVEVRPIDNALVTLPDVLQVLDTWRTERLELLERLDKQDKAIQALRDDLERANRPWYQKLFSKRKGQDQ